MKLNRLAAMTAAIIFAGCGPATPEAHSQNVAQPKAPTAPRAVHLSNFDMFSLRAGVNRIADFAGDGREGLIVLGWRDNGNAHGFDVFMILAPTRVGGSDYNVVTFGSETGWDSGADATSIADAPHTGEDFVRSVRFGRAMMNGRRETLAFVATRQIEESYPAPALTRIQVLAMRNRGDEGAGPVDHFDAQADFVTARRYCNSDAALRTELGVPLRAGYEGPDSADGCS